MASYFLVSTTRHLLAVEPGAGTASILHSGKGLYFGLATDDEGNVYAACRNAVAGPESAEVRAAERGTVLVFSSDLREIEEIVPPFPLRDVHGIAVFDTQLWVTCSFDNCIAICNLSTREWTRWYPVPEAAAAGSDSHHFNTICFADGIWVVAHRFGPSDLMRFSYPGLELESAFSLGIMAHDLFKWDGSLATFSSGEGQVVSLDGRRLRTGSFPRGFGEDDRGKLIGLSLQAPRRERHLQSAVLRWYTPQWEFVADYVLAGSGMVLDIMPLGREPSAACDRLERWPEMQVCAGEYNHLAPGNTYNLREGRLAGYLPGWHAPEPGLRWTAARNASFPVLVAPGECRLHLKLASFFDGPYEVEVRMDGELAGTVRFEGPGESQTSMNFAAGDTAERIVCLRVPHLWRPRNGGDARMLGIAVRACWLTL